MFGHPKDRHLNPSFAGTSMLSRQEEKHAGTRITEDQHKINYARHQQLIDDFDTSNIEKLRKNINDLPVLGGSVNLFENIPENKGSNLFYLIIFNADLPNNVKKELLNVLVFERGYDKWAVQLFGNPFYKKMLENGLCFQVLEDLYIKKFVNKDILPKETENHFLIKCFELSLLSPIDFYRMQDSDNKKFQLLLNWIDYQTHAPGIINVYDTIRHKDFNLTKEQRKSFLKIAKQKILDMEIKNPTYNSHDDEQIRDFLDINRDRWKSCFTCFFERRSMDIHKMIIQGNLDKASQAWGKEEQELKSFYSQYSLK